MFICLKQTFLDLLLENEVFDFNDKGWKRRIKDSVLSEFDFDAIGYPFGRTYASSDELEKIFLKQIKNIFDDYLHSFRNIENDENKEQ